MKAKGFKMVLFGIAILALFTTVVMLLWNALIPAVFGLEAINFWQALGLFALARILFGGFGLFGKGMMMHGAMHGKGGNPIHDKWMKMTPEQRKEFIQRRREFDFHDHPSKKEWFGRNCCNSGEPTASKQDE